MEKGEYLLDRINFGTYEYVRQLFCVARAALFFRPELLFKNHLAPTVTGNPKIGV